MPCILDHVDEIEKSYHRVIKHRRSSDLRASRLPWRVTFDTNPDDCNLHCDMCEGFSQYSSVAEERKGLAPRRMTLELVQRVVKELVDLHLKSGEMERLEVIPSTMGEPLLWRHFQDLLHLIREENERLTSQGHPGIQLNLTTNGTFPRLGVQKWAEEIIPITSDIKISWNGAFKETQEVIMKGQKFEEVLENLKQLVAHRDQVRDAGGHYCSLTLQCTFLEENYKEMPEIIELAAALGIDRVKGHHLWAHWEEMASRSMKRDAEAVRAWNEMVPLALEAAKAGGVRLEGIKVIPETAGEDLAPGAPCPFLMREFWVAADGRFNCCCAPDKERQSLGFFGNLEEQSLQEVLRGDLYKDLVATYSTRSLCKGCNMRRWK